MDKIIAVLGYKNFITEMSDAPDCFTIDTLVQYHTPKVLLLWACIHKLRGFIKTLGQEQILLNSCCFKPYVSKVT